MAAGAPGEHHEIGLLMIVVMLRWRGWDVKYLGPNLHLDRLDEALGPLRPRLLLFTATRLEAAEALRALPQVLARFPAPPPRIVVGGPAFAAGPARPLADWVHVEAEPEASVRAIEDLMQVAI